MRTKTLLVACAALALSLATSQAQVYSANVVGYVNSTVPAGGFVPMGNTLINGTDGNQTNNNINQCFGPGLISDPNIATAGNDPANGSNSVVFIWNGSSFNGGLYYFNAADATTWEGSSSPAGWYDSGGTYYPNIVVNQGQVAFLKNSSYSPAAMTVTLVGTVKQGTGSLTIQNGYNFISYQVPIGATNPIGPTFGLPTTLTSTNYASGVSNYGNPPISSLSDTIFTWNPSGLGSFNGGYFYFNAADATYWEGSASDAGFYDAGGTPMSSALYPAISQGFFLYHTGGALSWTPSFTVQ